MMKNQERFNELFDELVPVSGKADSLAGEIARAVGRIGYRFYNDGDQIGIGYGKETCNPAARFLIRKLPKDLGDLVAALWGMASEDAYDAVLDILAGKTVDYIEAHPELRSLPTEDMGRTASCIRSLWRRTGSCRWGSGWKRMWGSWRMKGMSARGLES